MNGPLMLPDNTAGTLCRSATGLKQCDDRLR